MGDFVRYCRLGNGSAGCTGCVCQKQGSPVFGGLETYLKPGEWQVTFGYRGYESTEHFQGRNPFPELDPNGPINKQHAATGELTYGLTNRWNVSVAAPWYNNGFAVRRAGPASATPYFQDTPVAGVGDLSVRGRYWLLTTDNPEKNVSVSGGVKFPNGRSNSMGTVFTPRNTTGVPTFFGSLTNPTNAVQNSAADQFSSQVGAAYVVRRGWPVPSVAYRIEGVLASPEIDAPQRGG